MPCYVCYHAGIFDLLDVRARLTQSAVCSSVKLAVQHLYEQGYTGVTSL